MPELNLKLVSQFIKFRIWHEEGLISEFTSMWIVPNRLTFTSGVVSVRRNKYPYPVCAFIFFPWNLYSKIELSIFMLLRNNKFKNVLRKSWILFFFPCPSKLMMYWSTEKQNEEHACSWYIDTENTWFVLFPAGFRFWLTKSCAEVTGHISKSLDLIGLWTDNVNMWE